MGKILIDNWTLERAAASINDTYEGVSTPNDEYASLIEALILWDDILFFENERSKFWQDILWRFDYAKYLKPICLPAIAPSPYILPPNSGIVEEGALDYFWKCKCLGIDYLAVQERADFLSEYIKRPDMLHQFGREEIMDHVDSKLKGFYQAIYGQHGKPYLQFRFPPLFDYVRNNTKDSKFYVNTALQLRNSNMVKRFHCWLDDFDDTIKAGKHEQAQLLLEDVDGLFDEFRFPIRITDVRMVISIPPSISAKIEIFPLPRRNWNLTFLRKVIKTSKNNRPIHEMDYTPSLPW